MAKTAEEINKRYTPDMNLEQTFRGQVRDILDLDVFTRDEQIFEELRELKRIEEVWLREAKIR